MKENRKEVNKLETNKSDGRPAQSERRPLGIYVHIPFCLQRCRYCGFYSQAVGGDSSAAQKEAAYTDRLIAELLGKGSEIGKDYQANTLFIGGGTPSILPPGIHRADY